MLIIFRIIIAYQLILKIMGGSWQTEAIIIALIIFNTGLAIKFKGHIAYHKALNQTKK